MEHLMPRQKGSPAPVKACESFEIDLRQSNESREFLGQGAVQGQRSTFHEKVAAEVSPIPIAGTCADKTALHQSTLAEDAYDRDHVAGP
jgi:hypothetical protein